MSEIKISEKKLEDLIEELFNNGELDCKLPVFSTKPFKMRRQVSIGDYGVADVIFIERMFDENIVPTINFHIIELKARQLKSKDFAQLSKYSKGLSHYLKYREFGCNYSINPILIGEHPSEGQGFGDSFFISDFSHIDTYCYYVDINGFGFEEVSIVYTNPFKLK